MNPKYRILIPIGLAVVAAAANFVLLQQATATTGVLVVSRDVPAGQPITRDDLTVAKLRGDAAVFAAAYPAANQNELIGMTFRRDMSKGGMVLKADANGSGDWVLQPGERTASLLVRAGNGADGLTTNDTIEVTLPTADGGWGGRVGPFRVLGTARVMSKKGGESFTRVEFAGTDVTAVQQAKVNAGDEFKLAGGTFISRVAKGTTGKQVSTRPAGE